MLVQFLCEFLTMSSVGLLILLPAAVVNRRTNAAVKNLSPEELRARTSNEIDELYCWYLSHMSRDEAISIGAAYARYSTQHQESIVDQLRKILEHAIKLRIFVLREYIFFDTAVTGKKRRRIGLSAAEDVLRAKRADAPLICN